MFMDVDEVICHLVMRTMPTWYLLVLAWEVLGAFVVNTGGTCASRVLPHLLLLPRERDRRCPQLYYGSLFFKGKNACGNARGGSCFFRAAACGVRGVIGGL